MSEPIPSILMTVDTVGGVWITALDLGRELVRHGSAVTFAVLGPAAHGADRDAAVEAGIEIVHLGAQPEWLAEKPVAVNRGAEALAQLAREMGADVIHINHPALAADVRFGRPVVAIAQACTATWWQAVKGTPLPENLRWQADAVGRGYAAATRVVAPCRSFAAATARLYGLSRQPMVVPVGRAPIESEGVGTAVDGVLTTGRLWDQGQNASVLDRAASLTTIPFRAAGPTRLGTRATTFDYMTMLDATSDANLRALLAERPIYASAALYDPAGLAVLDAARAGCALVLSDIESFRELWDGAATFVSPSDAAGFAGAAQRLIADRDLRQRSGEAARTRSCTYMLDAYVAGMTAIYRDAIATITDGLSDTAPR